MTTRFVPPYKLPVGMANGLLGTARALGIRRRPLDATRMKTWARRMTGLKDFGDPFFEEPLRLLLADINDDADLHEAGRLMHWYFLSGFLRNRLRMVDAWKRHPETLGETIRPPLIILGLPRTATTRLFNILSGAPNHRTLTLWEAVAPVRPKGEGILPLHTRRLKARTMLWSTDYLAPNFKAIHELLLEGPEECIHLLGNSFASWIFPIEYNAPRYTAWFDTVDHTQAYEEFKAQLQLLQIQKPTDRWLLKSPHHIFGIEALLKVFPDAMIVQTHRDPAKVVPSCCSLAQTTRGIACTSLDPKLLGEQITDQLALGLERTAVFRAQIPENRIVDVHFQEIVSQPMAVVRRIYDTFGLDLDAATEDGIKAELNKETPGKYGEHHYTLEQFGLSRAMIEDRFRTYYETFDVASEV